LTHGVITGHFLAQGEHLCGISRATSGEVFDDVSDEGEYGSVWYVASSTRVYCTVPQTGNIPNDIYVRYGTLKENGSITWESSSALPETNDGDKLTGIHGNCKPSICRSSDNKIWLVFPGDKDKDGAWENKQQGCFQRGNSGLTGWPGNSTSNGDEDKNPGGNDLAVVPYDDDGSVLTTWANDQKGTFKIWPCNGTTNWGAAKSPDKLYNLANADYYAALLPDPDLSAATVHIAYPEDAAGYLQYIKFVSGNSNIYTVNTSSSPWKNVTIGMAGDTSGSDIYIAATDVNGYLRVFKAESPYTTWNELSQDRWAPVNASCASLPVYGKPMPYPLPIIYYDENTGKVTFNRIVTSTYPAPTLTYLQDPQGRTSPASAGQTAQTTIDAYGSGFQDWGPMSASMGAGISVSSVTYISQTHCQITFSVSQDAGGGYRNVSVSNPDGQSSNVLTSSFVVTVPQSQIDNIWPPLINVGGSYYSKGVSSFTGTSSYNSPPSPAQLSTTKIKIIKTSNNQFWNGSGFQDPTGDPEDEYLSASGTSPWSYSEWKAQTPGQEYALYSRGYTDDGGKGADSAAKIFTIDQEFNSNVINNPTGGKFYTNNTYNPDSENLTSLTGKGTDNGVGVTTITVRISEDVGMDNDISNDLVWDWCGSSYSWVHRSTTTWWTDPKKWPNVQMFPALLGRPLEVPKYG